MKQLKITAYDLTQMCRLCLSHDLTATDIFRFSTKLGQEIAEVIMQCAPVHITQHDEMPAHICQLCYNKLEGIREFQNQIVQSEKTLRNYIQHLHSGEKQIKNESLSQSSSDGFANQHPSLDVDIIVKCEPLETNDVFDSNISQSSSEMPDTPNILSDMNKEMSPTLEKNYHVRIKEEYVIPLNMAVSESPGPGLSETAMFNGTPGDEYTYKNTKMNFDAAKLTSECPSPVKFVNKIENGVNSENFKEKSSINSNVLNDVNEELIVKFKEEPDVQLNVPDTNSECPDGSIKVASEDTKIYIDWLRYSQGENETDCSHKSIDHNSRDVCFQKEPEIYQIANETCGGILDSNINENKLIMPPVHLETEDPLKINVFTNTLEEMTSNINQCNVSTVSSQNEGSPQDSTKVCFQNESEIYQTLGGTCEGILDSNINGNQPNILYQVRLKNEDPSNARFFITTSDTFAAASLNKKIKILLPKFVPKGQQGNLMKINKRRTECEKPEKIHECHVCNKHFKTVSSLKQHIKLHSEKFQCNICNKVFTRMATLILHEQLHSGAKPHQCDICSKSFACPFYLTRHKKLHVKTRSFCCNVCNKTFTCSEYLRKHKKTHYTT